MGATITTGKLIAAFKDVKGKTFYIIYEETYDRNCYPHTPKWSARAIGDLALMMRLIFWSASSAEGGMLQGPGGRWLTPEGYVSGYLKELANPVEIHDRSFDLSVGHGWSAVIGADSFPKIRAKLEGIGEAAIAGALDQGETVTVSLFEHAEALSVIFDGVDLWASRILQGYSTPTYGTRNPSLGYAPAKVKPPLQDTLRVLKISQDDANIIVQHPDGSWRCDGWGYSYVANYVKNLWETELKYPGSFRSLIKSYRQAIDGAPTIPAGGVTIVVDTSFPLGAYDAQAVERIRDEYGCKTVGSEVHIPFVAGVDFCYAITRLPEKAARWVFDDNATSAPHRAAEQLCLLAS